MCTLDKVTNTTRTTSTSTSTSTFRARCCLDFTCLSIRNVELIALSLKVTTAAENPACLRQSSFSLIDSPRLRLILTLFTANPFSRPSLPLFPTPLLLSFPFKIAKSTFSAAFKFNTVRSSRRHPDVLLRAQSLGLLLSSLRTIPPSNASRLYYRPSNRQHRQF